MALTPDAQVLSEITPLLAALGDVEPPPVGDVQARRINGHRMFDLVAASTTPAEGVATEHFSLTASDGAALDATWYRRTVGQQPGSAALYLHGGGMIFGLEHIGSMYDVAVREYVASSGVPMLMVDYRIAPEHPHPTPVEDCYAALVWLAEQASSLGVDPNRIAVMGDSAGGGLAADLDIFRDEDITYARRLSDAGVPTELHLHPGCPHAFEGLARGADVSKRAVSDRVRRLRSL